MYCKYCGKSIEEKAEICVHCGRRVRSSISSILENHEFTRLKPLQAQKSPGLAGFLGFTLSWIFLGPVGYLYLGQWNWFWLTAVISIFGYIATFGLAFVVFPLIFAVHQYQMARELNEMMTPAAPADETPSS